VKLPIGNHGKDEHAHSQLLKILDFISMKRKSENRMGTDATSKHLCCDEKARSNSKKYKRHFKKTITTQSSIDDEAPTKVSVTREELVESVGVALGKIISFHNYIVFHSNASNLDSAANDMKQTNNDLTQQTPVHQKKTSTKEAREPVSEEPSPGNLDANLIKSPEHPEKVKSCFVLQIF